MHFYNFNIKDYASHTAHLEHMEDLAYRRMLDWCYLHESPLPESVEEIARNIRMREHCNCIAIVLQEFFVLTENGYENKHAKKVIAEMQKLSGKRSKAAKRRWANSGKGSKADASALQLESTSNATHNLKPITHNPVKEKDLSNDKSKSKRSVKTSLPDGFCISENVKTWAREKNHKNLDRHLEYFIGKAKANGYKYANWDQALMNAIRENWAKIPDDAQQHKPRELVG